MSCKPPVLLIVSCILMFTSLILTLTHSGFQCDVDKTGASRQQCSYYGLDTTKEEICFNSVYQITSQLIIQKEVFDIEIVCPFDFWTTFTNFLGVIAGLVFVALTILQRMQKEFSTRKFAVRLGWVSVVLVVVSVIVMGCNINGGMKNCKLFLADMEAKGITSDADCSVAVFAWDISLMCVGVVLLGYESYLEWAKYRFGDNNEEYFAKEDATQVASDYQTRFFENN